MCELLGMSANVPTDITFSFSGLVQRGGNTGPHKDGWGITFYEGKGQRTFKDSNPIVDSDIAKLVQSYPIKSQIVISHIRQANRGSVTLENTHPFVREYNGQYWTFAHNGQLTGYETLETGHFKAVGQTDSEHIFCWLMHRISQYQGSELAGNDFYAYVGRCCDELRALGVFNMLLTNGEYIMTYCSNNLHWIMRRAPFGNASLIDDDMQIDFSDVTTPNDIVTVIATQPLTEEESWNKMLVGEFNVFRLGERVFSNR